MEILVTNDDGIFAPGLAALAAELARLGRVHIVAPAAEQSGVSHSITYLQPLIVEEILRDGRLFGRSVAGRPADCVKLAMLEFCPQPVDLVVSGINSGANVGINVLYSGTVAAAIEGAFFGVTSIAVSQDIATPPDYAQAAKLAVNIIAQLLEAEIPAGSLWNLNLPASQPAGPRGVKLLPMGLERYRDKLERRTDPRGRTYYWAGTDAAGSHTVEPGTDVEAVADGFASLTPLHFNLTDNFALERFKPLHLGIHPHREPSPGLFRSDR